MKKINKIFIANRGEIAQRIVRSARKMRIDTVVPVSVADQNLDYIKLASDVVRVDSKLSTSFLNQEKMVELAMASGADAIHPGYGFLSENADFARLCVEKGLTWIGPSSDLIRRMGNKQQAIESARALGIPTLEGRFGNADTLMKGISRADLPLIIKASNGGGGKGIQIVHKLSELKGGLEKASREALNVFGSPEVFIEKYIPKARHIEVQVMCDLFGNMVHFYTRECSVQRRFQKLIEEAPAPGMPLDLQSQLFDASLNLCRFISYENAGTVEFIIDGNDFYFLEMNTRIQVEHPVSEEITGFDFIELQIRIASGEKLMLQQDDIQVNGHAIESRIYAEDPQRFFSPAPGNIKHLNYPEHENIRIETAIKTPQTLPVFYDPLLAKIISKGSTRSEAIRLHQHALENTLIDGISTTSNFLSLVIADERFKAHAFYTKLLDDEMPVFLEKINSSIHTREKLLIGLYQYILHRQPPESPGKDVWSKIGFWRSIPGDTVYVNDNILHIEKIDVSDSSIRFSLNGEFVFIEDVRVERNKLSCRFKEITFIFFMDETSMRSGLKANSGGFRLEVKRFNSCNGTDESNALSQINGHAEVKADLPGKVVKLNVQEGKKISSGEPLLVFESMKIENTIYAGCDGIVQKVNISEGQQLKQNEVLLIIADK